MVKGCALSGIQLLFVLWVPHPRTGECRMSVLGIEGVSLPRIHYRSHTETNTLGKRRGVK